MAEDVLVAAMSMPIDQAYVLPTFIEHLTRHTLVEVRAYVEDGALLSTWSVQRDCMCLMCVTARTARRDDEEPTEEARRGYPELDCGIPSEHREAKFCIHHGTYACTMTHGEPGGLEELPGIESLKSLT
jgi:hypothetical protein